MSRTCEQRWITRLFRSPPVSVRQANPRKPQFPIFDDSTEYRKRGRSRIADIDPTAKAIIESSQPYNQSEPKADLLYLLEVLSNIDKHRVIHAVAQSVMRVQARTLHGSLEQALRVNLERDTRPVVIDESRGPVGGQ